MPSIDNSYKPDNQVDGSSQVNNTIYSNPDIVFKTPSQTLSNKILDSTCDISSIIPANLVTTTGTQNLTNKTIQVLDGSAASPSCAFSDCGFFRVSAGVIGISTNGTQQMTISNTSINVSRVIYASDTGYKFSNGNNTGVEYSSNVLYLANGGTRLFRLQSAQIYSDSIHNFTNGSNSTPGLVSGSYQTTGLSWTAGPNLNVSVNGSRVANFENSGMRLYGSIGGNNALYSASLLGHYEEYEYTNAVWKWGDRKSTASYRLTRVGRLVHFQLMDVIDFSPLPPTSIQYSCEFDTASYWIPLRFRPSVLIHQIGSPFFYDNITTSYKFAQCQLDNSNGNIIIVRLDGAVSDWVRIYRFTAMWIV